MKKIIFTGLLMAMSFFVNAQAFHTGSKDLNLGIGFGYGTGFMGSLDYGLNNDISVGVGAGYSSRTYGIFDLKQTNIAAYGRASYHFTKFIQEALHIDANKIDTYIGLNLGLRNYSYKSNIYNQNGGTNLFLGGHLGARYKINNKLGLYGEVGTPYSSIGLNFGF